MAEGGQMTFMYINLPMVSDLRTICCINQCVDCESKMQCATYFVTQLNIVTYYNSDQLKTKQLVQRTECGNYFIARLSAYVIITLVQWVSVNKYFMCLD